MSSLPALLCSIGGILLTPRAIPYSSSLPFSNREAIERGKMLTTFLRFFQKFADFFQIGDFGARIGGVWQLS
jgi:hypothetical protein